MLIKEGIRVKREEIPDIKGAMLSFSYKNIRKNKLETTVEFDVTTNEFIFPRNIEKFKEYVLDFNEYTELRNKDFSFNNEFKLKDNYKLYSFQKKIVREILENLNTFQGSCVLKAPPGTGKTYMLPYIVNKLKQKTLILVDRTNLVEQMYKEFMLNADGDIQILNSKSDYIADINIATLQLLNANQELLNKLKQEVSFVIVDEVHLISIGALTKVFTQIPAYYRLGLSATPTRSDGLTQAIYDHFGFNIVESNNPYNLKVYHIIINHRLQIYYSGKLDANRAWQELYAKPKLVEEIVDLAITLKSKGRTIFIYNTQQDTQKTLQYELMARGYSAGVINANTKAKERNQILEAFSIGELDFLISGVILQKGISIHRMDTIINYSNHTKESFEQMVGRVRRLHEDKKDPLIFHFCFKGKGNYKCKYLKEWAENLKSQGDKVVYWTYDKFKKEISKN